jgi:HEAT repeat protein
MNALVAMGPLGLERAQQMVEDPRWFVVRNGVALLGELSEETSVEYLTTALAHDEARVRKEAVWSLAKVGGSDAETLLIGMLADQEAGVRARTCQALAKLKSTRAVKPLLELLRDPSPDVQVESIQALGQIGDPGAVRPVERRALGGLLSRPTREVRIAAFRALKSIGTPGAMAALEKGVKDRDKGVQAVVKALVETD